MYIWQRLVIAASPLGAGPFAPPCACMGPDLMGIPGPMWARLLWAPMDPYGPGPCGPPWALMGRTLMGRALIGHPSLINEIDAFNVRGPGFVKFLSTMPTTKHHISINIYIYIYASTRRLQTL